MVKSGIVIDIEKKYVTVLTEENEYYKLARKPTMYISQEIHFKMSDVINTAYILKRVSLVAAIALIIGISVFIGIMSNSNSYNNNILAYISLDINPSIQFAVNKDYKVVDTDYMNKDARELLGDLKPKGMKINEAFYIIINRCEEKGITKDGAKNYFLISGAVNSSSNTDKDELKANESKLSSLLSDLKDEVGARHGENNQIDVFQLDRNDIEAAKKSGISLGRYALYKELVKTGSKLSLDDAKRFEVSDLIITYHINKGNMAYNVPTTNTPETNTQENNISETNMPSANTPDANTPATKDDRADETADITGKITNTPNGLNTDNLNTNSLNTNNLSTKNISSTPTKGSNDVQTVIKPSTNTPESTPTATPKPETGTGLLAEYYDNIDLTKLVTTRIDKHINFYWFTGAEPAPGVRNDDSYSVRWTGYIKPPSTGEYKFYVSRDNGARLWIDNKLIIDQWNDQWNVIDTAKITLTGNKKYDIKLEYYNNTGNGIISLWWNSVSVEKSIVPSSYLYPAEKKPQPTVLPGEGKGLCYEYYDNTDLTDLKAKGIDTEINFNWGTGSPDQRVHQDQKYSIRWTGYVQPVSDEKYKFYLEYDGGVKLWIDDVLEINEWGNSSKDTASTREIKLKAGKKHKIKIEYFNGNLNGRVKLLWSSPTVEKSVIPMTRLYPNE